MARTTLAIDDDLLERLKEKSARESRPMHEVANDLLRQALVEQAPRERVKIQLRGWEAVQQPGVDLLDREKLFDLMDGR
jgi:plasmid stability protein